jgi:flagellar protein FlgJ
MDGIPPVSLPLPAGRPQPVAAGDAAARIEEVAQGFEAIFMRQIVKGLRKTATVDEDSAFMNGIYSDMLDEQLADHLARSGGLGLAAVIRAYLERAPK